MMKPHLDSKPGRNLHFPLKNNKSAFELNPKWTLMLGLLHKDSDLFKYKWPI